jgi:hypothetical protein
MNETYEFNGKKYIRVKSECKCLGCDFLDEETADCLAPMPKELGADCIERVNGEMTHFQFKEIDHE